MCAALSSGAVQRHAVNANRSFDILQGLLTHVLESEVQTVANVITDWP